MIAMKKYMIALLLLPLLAWALSGCDEDENEVNPDLLPGQWELISRSHQDYGRIYDFEQIPADAGHTTGEYRGSLITYYITVAGTPIYNQSYNWEIREVADEGLMLNLTFIGDLDSYEADSENVCYKILRLTPTHLWLQPVGPKTDHIIFRRRTDIADI